MELVFERKKGERERGGAKLQFMELLVISGYNGLKAAGQLKQ